MDAVQPPIIVAPRSAHTHTVVFLHGRGSTARNFASSLDYSRDSRDRTLADIFPSFRWVFPRAPLRQPAAFPGDKVPQWFDIWNVRDFSDREDVQVEGLRESVGRILDILAQEATALGGHWERIILMGISQGAATSVHTLLQLHQAPRLGAFIGFSCRMPFPGRTLLETRKVLARDVTAVHADSELLKGTPMLLEHCVDDQLVLVENGRKLRDTLRGFGADVAWREYPDGGHWFNSPAGMDDVAEFLCHVLGLRQEAAATLDPMDAS